MIIEFVAVLGSSWQCKKSDDDLSMKVFHYFLLDKLTVGICEAACWLCKYFSPKFINIIIMMSWMGFIGIFYWWWLFCLF